MKKFLNDVDNFLHESLSGFAEAHKDIVHVSLDPFYVTRKNINPNKKRMFQLADTGFITATDLADYLVKNHSMSFRDAYQKTAEIVNYAEKKRKKLKDLKIEELKKIEPKLSNEVLKIFDLKNSINSKKSYGGTSFENIKRMIIKYKKKK